MNNYKIQYLLTIACFLFSINSYSQVSQVGIKGVVYGADHEPSQFSTIVLMNKDSVFMKGTLSKNDGSFLIDKMVAGSYFVMVRNIEFNTFVSRPIVIESNKMYVLDTIRLETKVNGLAEVVIKGEKPLIEVLPDKMVYNVAQSVNASGNNGIELLSKAPGILVDMDKNISLMGKQGVKIYINGRPTRLSGTDLSTMLESIRSDDIQSIDIITNPSSKYEADGAGGIIDIKMKRNYLVGFNGNVNANYSQGIYNSESLGTGLNYNTEKLTIFSTLNFSKGSGMDNTISRSEREKFYLDMDSRKRNYWKGTNLGGGFEYKINSESTLGWDARALFNQNTNNNNSSTLISEIREVNPPVVLQSQVLSETPSENYNMNLFYNFIPNGSSTFTADLSIGHFTNNVNTQQPNTYYREDGSVKTPTVNSEYETQTAIDVTSAKVDYEKKFNKLSFSTGAKYASISTDNSLDFYNFVDQQPVLNKSRSNQFAYLEKVAAAYVTLGTKLGKNSAFNSGLRVENTSSLGELTSAVTTANDKVARNYTSWFPNISFSYDDQKTHALSLSFGRRISRPNYQNLNPFENKLSEIASWKGNPFLKPNYTTNYDIKYTYKHKLLISNSFSVTRDFFATIFETTDSLSNILIPRNMDKVFANSVYVNYTEKLLPWWNMIASSNYSYTTYDGNLNGTVINIKVNYYNFRMQNTIDLPQKIRMEFSYFYGSPWLYEGSIFVKGNHRVDLGFKRDFLKNKLKLQVNASDLLHSNSDFYYHSDYGGIKVRGIRSFDWARWGISATYNFGNQKMKERKQKNAANEDEMNRI